MGRRHSRNRKKKFGLKFIVLLIITLAAAYSLYFFLLVPRNIICGVLVDKKTEGKYTELELYSSGKTQKVLISKKISLEDADAYNVKLHGLRVISIVPCNTYSGKILSRDSKNIETENGKYPLRNDISYVKLENNKVGAVTQNSLIVGYDYKLISDNNGKIGAVIVGKPDIDTVRVGISNSDFSSMKHTSLVFFSITDKNLNRFYAFNEDTGNLKSYAGKGLNIKSLDIQAAVKKGELLKIDYKNEFMELSVYTVDNKGNLVYKSAIGKTKNRIYISSVDDTKPVYIKSLKRANGHKPVYYGNFEVYIKDSEMRLINEVDLENYLRFVVPSEMLPSGGIEAYKTQAVAARTYVLWEMLAGSYAQSGFHVDDTTMTQAYNAQPSVSDCDKAISETKGEVITYDNKIIDAKYYSTSCGVGAPYNEIYYKGTGYKKKNPEPYLVFNNFTDTKIGNLTEESNISVFLKDWTIKSYDSNSPYFRWSYSMNKKTLNATINKNIYIRYQKSPASIMKKWYLNIYNPTKISKDGIGDIIDISISKRGSAGNVMEMIIESDTGIYKIIGETNIKRILTPDSLEITPLYGKTIKSMTALPSPYFVIDKQFSNNKVKNVTIYGGGFGHGVGLSQYGTIGLVHQGKTYQDIINLYYKNVKFTDYKEALENSL